MFFDVNEKNTLFTDRVYSRPDSNISARMTEKTNTLGINAHPFRKRDVSDNWLQAIPALTNLFLVFGTIIVLYFDKMNKTSFSLVWSLVSIVLFIIMIAVVALIIYVNYGKFIFGGKKTNARVAGFVVMKKRRMSFTPVFEYVTSDGRTLRVIDRFCHKDVFGNSSPKLGDFCNIKVSDKDETDIFWKYPTYSMAYTIFMWSMSLLIFIGVFCSGLLF